MPQFLLHYALAFSAQSPHRYHVEPTLLWDLRYPSEYARLASQRDRRLSSSVKAQYATSPPVPIFRITCGLFPYREWTIEIRNSRGVTVGDVLNALYRELRHRISPLNGTARLGLIRRVSRRHSTPAVAIRQIRNMNRTPVSGGLIGC